MIRIPSLRKNAWRSAFGILAVMFVPAMLWAGDTPASEKAKPQTTATAKPQGDFVLTVKDERLSLRATNARVNDVVHAIGQQMQFDVVTQLPETETVTVTFDRLTLRDAFFKLNINFLEMYALQDGKPKIVRINVVPKLKIKRKAEVEPSEFNVDPSKMTPKAKVKQNKRHAPEAPEKR